ncbi:MAG: polysaccharide deacetylase family protein [Paludibacter sp.]|nr:polysaccharide deacetylase family protein [Paludibacter sp.]
MPALFFKIKRKINKLFHPAWGEILMLHRVVQKQSQLQANRQMEVTPEFLEKRILDYQARGYRFVSLDEVHEIVSTQKRLKQKFVCFTFDDGYMDNYELAYPVFQKFNCPFAIYITTDFPDGKALLWWYVLEDLLMSNTELKLGDGSYYDCSTIEKKDKTFDAIRQKIFNFPAENMVQKLNQLFVNQSHSFEGKNKALALTWTQIEALAKNDLCTIAAHTVSHGVLPNMSLEDVVLELRNSKYQLEKHINKPVLHFAYPYGAWNDSVLNQVIAAGFKTAVLGNGGKVRKGDDTFMLKRIN